MEYQELIANVKQWAEDRELIDQANVRQQAMKVVEEVGELCEGINKNKPLQVLDSMGDVQVTLIILCAQLGIDYKESLEEAYAEIKNRTGKTVNGTFVKSADLK